MKGSDVQNLPEGFGDVFPFQERTFLAKNSVKVYSVVVHFKENRTKTSRREGFEKKDCDQTTMFLKIHSLILRRRTVQ